MPIGNGLASLHRFRPTHKERPPELQSREPTGALRFPANCSETNPCNPSHYNWPPANLRPRWPTVRWDGQMALTSQLDELRSAVSVFDDGADALAQTHLGEGLIHVLKFDPFGYHRIKIDAALHIQVDDLREVN